MTAKKPSELDPRAECPLCQKERAVPKFAAADEFLRIMARPSMSAYYCTVGGSQRIVWACEACMTTGRAMRAEPEKQSFGLGGPVLAFAGVELTCRSCRQQFVFSAGEQKHWYEVLGFWIDSWPRDCPTCRSKRRKKKQANRQLAAQLENLDPEDSERLEAIAMLYEELGSPSKATEFARRAANVRKRKQRPV